jgi:hypothetical protein
MSAEMKTDYNDKTNSIGKTALLVISGTYLCVLSLLVSIFLGLLGLVGLVPGLGLMGWGIWRSRANRKR